MKPTFTVGPNSIFCEGTLWGKFEKSVKPKALESVAKALAKCTKRNLQILTEIAKDDVLGDCDVLLIESTAESNRERYS